MDGSAAPHDFWDTVPTVEEPIAPRSQSTAATAADAGGSGTGLALQTTIRAHRRTLLKTATALGGALALSVLSWLPPARGGPAYARVGTEYLDCTVFSYPDTIICTGAPYSQGYCGSDGWFLQYTGTCFVSGPVTVCNGRNAWRWNYGGTPYRCADGMQYWCGGSAFLICSWPNP